MLAVFDPTPMIVAAIAGLFGGGGIVAMMKVGKEGSRIIADAAATAVAAQGTVIDTLRADIDLANATIAKMRAEIREARREAAKERDARYRAEWRAEGLEERVRLLQADVEDLRQQIGKGNP